MLPTAQNLAAGLAGASEYKQGTKVKGRRMEEPEFDVEAAADQAIQACDGDLRAAVKSLIVANNYLTMELERTWQLVSPGYSRQKGARRRSTGAD
jgi:hypothetical protein